VPPLPPKKKVLKKITDVKKTTVFLCSKNGKIIEEKIIGKV